MRTSRSPVRAVLVAVVAAVVVLLAPATALAHSFLIRSDPAAGARLASSSQLLRMFFSEPFIAASEHVSIRRAGGVELKLQPARARQGEILQPLPSHLHGIYVVSWRVLSDDGHISLGEFAFAVGSTAALPTLGTGASGSTPISEVAASWLFFIGFAFAVGGIVAERLFWRGSGTLAATGGAPAFLAVVIALL